MSARALALALTGAAALAAAPAVAGPPSAAKRRTVQVADNFFGPTRLTVRAGTKLTWRWTDDAADIHDVKLTSGPKGVRRFHSAPAAAGFVYSRTLKTPGTYRILCTFHEEDDMRMTIRVRR
jgi:plastocyanin